MENQIYILEEFKTIEGFNYEISTLGRVRNMKNDKYLNNIIGNRGYEYVGLYSNKIRKNKINCIKIYNFNFFLIFFFQILPNLSKNHPPLSEITLTLNFYTASLIS